MDVYFVRHARTSANSLDMVAGSGIDIAISEEGRRMAGHLAASPEFKEFLTRFEGGFPGRVYVSPMKRAVTTAEILFPKSPKIPLDDLREISFGRFEGRNQYELGRSPEYIAWFNQGPDVPMPGGESFNGVTERICQTLVGIIRREEHQGRPNGPVVIVSHGGVCMALYHRFIEPEEHFFHHYVPNCGIRHFDCRVTPDGDLDLKYLDSPLSESDTYTTFMANMVKNAQNLPEKA
jgi:alpha-ribazole phosphatase